MEHKSYRQSTPRRKRIQRSGKFNFISNTHTHIELFVEWDKEAEWGRWHTLWALLLGFSNLSNRYSLWSLKAHFQPSSRHLFTLSRSHWVSCFFVKYSRKIMMRHQKSKHHKMALKIHFSSHFPYEFSLPDKYVYSVTMTTASYRQQFSTSLEGIRHILTLGIRKKGEKITLVTFVRR
jgi:hypothetical protein